MGKPFAIFIMLIMLFAGCKRDPVIEPVVELTDSTLVKIAGAFEQELIRQGIDKTGRKDGMIRYGDAKNVDSLYIYGSHLIESFKGIEYFINIRSLTLYMTQQDSLDLSKNEKLEYLNCQTGVDMAGVRPSLSYLNIRNCKKLTYLNCYNNLLTTIDVGQNTALKYLNIGLNGKLQAVDVSANTQLEVFRSEGCWELASLDVSKNLKLVELYCASNYKLTSLNVSMLSELTSLSIESCYNLVNLNLGVNPKMENLNISSAKITPPDFNKTPNISLLYINSTKFSSLDLSPLKKLRGLGAAFAELPGLNLSSNTMLESIDISGNNLKEIDFTNNFKLTQLYCRHQSNITKLDLRGKTIQVCLTFNCEKLNTICVDKIPDAANENWKTSTWTKYDVCKD